MISITAGKKSNCIAEVINIGKYSRKTNKLRNVYTIGTGGGGGGGGGGARNISIKKWGINNFKIKIIN